MTINVLQPILQSSLQGILDFLGEGGDSPVIPPPDPPTEETFYLLIGSGTDALLIGSGTDKLLWRNP